MRGDESDSATCEMIASTECQFQPDLMSFIERSKSVPDRGKVALAHRAPPQVREADLDHDRSLRNILCTTVESLASDVPAGGCALLWKSAGLEW